MAASILRSSARGKDRATGWVVRLCDAAQHKIGDPTLRDKGTLPINAGPLLNQVALINAQLSDRRHGTRALRTEVRTLAGECDRVALELKAERGERITADDLRPERASRQRTKRR